MIRDFILELFKFIGELNYWHVAILSALESTAFPVVIPVETIVIPMGYYAYLGTKSLPLLMFSCTIGIVCGCLVNYWFARILGRNFIYKHARFLHINIDKLRKLEEKFLAHGRLLMFVGRFVPIPAFKHIITIPAGMARMPVLTFMIYNALGGFIFSTSMLLIGYFFGSSEELIHKAIGKFTIACVVLLVMYVVVKIIINIIIKRRKRIAVAHGIENNEYVLGSNRQFAKIGNAIRKYQFQIRFKNLRNINKFTSRDRNKKRKFAFIHRKKR